MFHVKSFYEFNFFIIYPFIFRNAAIIVLFKLIKKEDFLSYYENDKFDSLDSIKKFFKLYQHFFLHKRKMTSYLKNLYSSFLNSLISESYFEKESEIFQIKENDSIIFLAKFINNIQDVIATECKLIANFLKNKTIAPQGSPLELFIQCSEDNENINNYNNNIHKTKNFFDKKYDIREIIQDDTLSVIVR